MPKVIIGSKRYALERRNLLCEWVESDPRLFFNLKSKTKRLYFPQGKAYILVATHDMTLENEYKIISQKEAAAFMDKHPEGIKERVYVRYFGQPEDV